MRKKDKTAGKTASIPTYRRGQFNKFGITDYRNMKRVLYPDDYSFSFCVEGFPIEVSPAKDILPTEAYETLVSFVRVFPIMKGSCHMTAFKVAQCLEEFGVLYCDGYYEVQGDHRRYCHSFCKYGDKYFDPTYEFGIGWGGKRVVYYYSSRAYEPREIKVYFATATMMTTGFTGETVITPSTVDYEIDCYDTEYPKLFMIDDTGSFQHIDNPYYSTSCW